MKKLAVALGFATAVGLMLGAAGEQKNCPVSGKPIDEAVTVDVNGKKVAFCCKGCPDGFVKKQLNVSKAGDKCPISGRGTKEETKVLHAEMVYFCCDKCPKAFAKKNEFAVQEKANTKCPISGKPINDESFLTVNGGKVYFCCENCPKAYTKQLLGVVDKGPAKCPISGGKAKKATGQIFVKDVRFCCNNCRGKYIKNTFTAAAQGGEKKAEKKEKKADL